MTSDYLDSVAIIPARGGSKRIPRKNIALFDGEPIISYSIKTALSSGLFKRVLVSTDDEEIAAVARKYGAETPFIRPSALADDYATTADVMRHAATWLRSDEPSIKYACCLYATAPLTTPDDLRTAHRRLLQNSEIEMCVPVTTYDYPIQRALRLADGDNILFVEPDHLLSRSQDLEPAYHDTGQFYFGKLQRWLGTNGIFGHTAIGVKIESWRVQDIDTQEDWQRAELIYKLLQY